MQEPAWYELLPISAEGAVSTTSWPPVPPSVRQERRTDIVEDTAVAGRRECVAARKWKGASPRCGSSAPYSWLVVGCCVT